MAKKNYKLTTTDRLLDMARECGKDNCSGSERRK